jgi:hypothetical protein
LIGQKTLIAGGFDGKMVWENAAFGESIERCHKVVYYIIRIGTCLIDSYPYREWLVEILG